MAEGKTWREPNGIERGPARLGGGRCWGEVARWVDALAGELERGDRGRQRRRRRRLG
jgi:hypothetical protein